MAGSLPVNVYQDEAAVGAAAAADMAAIIKDAIGQRGAANLILATGNSQLAFLRALRVIPGIDWSQVTVFHMDEYIGIDPDHRASFPRFLRQHFFDHVEGATFYPMSGDATRVAAICAEYEELLRSHPVDAVALGFGENGHLAFNDPPVARFDDTAYVKLVKLDDACKLQQVKEGHFPTLETVPPYALTLTIPALMTARNVICLAPEKRKSQPVRDALRGPVATTCPASFLRRQPHATLLLDTDSAALL